MFNPGGRLPSWTTTAGDGAEVIYAGDEDLFWKYGLAICLCQIDALSRAKHSALPGLYIARYGPQPRSHIERIDAERRPEGKLAGPMLFCMASGAQWNGVTIARFHPCTTISSGPHMRGFRWRCFAAGYARELTDKS
jgi:hypothetical protein